MKKNSIERIYHNAITRRLSHNLSNFLIPKFFKTGRKLQSPNFVRVIEIIKDCLKKETTLFIRKIPKELIIELQNWYKNKVEEALKNDNIKQKDEEI